MPHIPEGLPTSCVVLDHFSDFCKAAPRASEHPNCHLLFYAFLRLDKCLTPEQAAPILKRAEYPL